MKTSTLKNRIIILSKDHSEGEEFAEYLRSLGHRARVGDSTGNYVDGWWTALCEKKQTILNYLWEQYCLGYDEEAL